MSINKFKRHQFQNNVHKSMKYVLKKILFQNEAVCDINLTMLLMILPLIKEK